MKMPNCAYCGKNPGATRDHVIPQCLFIAPLPEFMVTVPACPECNGPSKSRDDTYLRDMLVLHHGSENHPVANAIAHGAAWRASKKNRSEVANSLRQRGKRVSVYKQGLLIGEGGLVPLEEDRIRRIFAVMLRGLHYKVTERILPADTKFELVSLSYDQYSEQLASWRQKSCMGPATLGHQDALVFAGYYFLWPKDPYAAIWLVTFYRGIHYLLCSHHPGDTGFGRKTFRSFQEIDHWDFQ